MTTTAAPRRRVIFTSLAVGTLGIAACATLGFEAANGTTTISGQGTPAAAAQTQQPALGYGQFGSGGSGYGGFGRYGGGGYSSGGFGSGGFGSGGFGSGGFGGYGTGGSGSGSTGSSTTAPTAKASSAQMVGVVDINTVLQYQSARAAGTGMILSSNGEILTNNHVVDGATSIKVTVVSTGATYTAKVVGTDPTADVAVIQLQNARGLKTAKISSTAVNVGATVTGVGNAGGVGGVPSAASGTVTALNQSITASDENGSNPEQLTGLIETSANIQAGDSGGPLYNSANQIVGMDTAASSGGAPDAYAIPIATAESIANQIENGVDNATIHHGYPAFLGVSVADTANGGAGIAQVVSGGPADAAGLAAGDVITSIDGNAVSSASALSSVLGQYNPGDRVSVGYVDAYGASGTVTVTLATGPAD